MIRFGLTTCFSLTISISAIAHPTHFSFAEVDWNEATKCFEVCLQLEPADLERALRELAQRDKRSNGRLALESDRAHNIVESYVKKHFRLGTSANEHQELRWIGFEVDVTAAWAYFEIPFPQPPSRLNVVNTLLVGVADQQINVVNVRVGPAMCRGEYHQDETQGWLEPVEVKTAE